jgi:hypothetical protein
MGLGLDRSIEPFAVNGPGRTGLVVSVQSSDQAVGGSSPCSANRFVIFSLRFEINLNYFIVRLTNHESYLVI